MTYTETIKYLNSFINYEMKTKYSYKESFKLERFRSFLKTIDNPQKYLNVIHVAGTKGKGSVCAFIAYILKEAGFKVGLYTSPHLSDFRERIRILKPITNNKQFLNADIRQSNADLRKFNLRQFACPPDHRAGNPRESALKNSFLTDFEGMISKQEICELVKKLKPKIEKFNKNSKYDALTFFEVYTAVAFQYFKNKKVDTSTSLSINPERTSSFGSTSLTIPSDHPERSRGIKSGGVEEVDFVVLETGLGGRLDATNTCNSLVSVITPLSLEHTYLLGDTLKEIAFEKASIIKKKNKKSACGKRLVLSAKQDKSAMAVIEKVARKNKAILFQEGRDFKFSVKNGSFDYCGLNYKLNNLKINLLGRHQIANASLAIATVEALRYHNIDVDKETIRRGLKNCFWPARFEVVLKDPLIILDGAQNSASVRVLHKAVKENFSDRKIWLIFGISQDKELKDTCKEIARFNARFILTKADNPRAAEPKYLLKYFNSDSMILTNTTKDALNIARANAKKKDLILVTGSLFVCGEVREAIRQ